MTIRKLKEIIKDLPDDMRVCADDGSYGMFSDNNEFLSLVYAYGSDDMCVLQTRDDFETDKELEAWCKYAFEHDVDEQDFWSEFAERGYVPEDFHDEERARWARENLENYGLM